MDFDRLSNSSPFGDLLRRYRGAQNLTQEVLAERAGVSVRAISDLERGARRHPYRETANQLAAALGLAGSDRAALLSAARRPTRLAGERAQPGVALRLPIPLDGLIGRDADLADVVSTLRDDRIRLLILTGPAGVGKTRLAMAAGNALRHEFRDGIVFVDLAPLQEASAVLPTLAAALKLHDRGAIPLAETLQRALSNRQTLLILDNFEHLLDAAPTLSDILQSAPGVQALVTSRAPLRLRGEREYPVRVLATPEPGAAISPDALADWDAIRLFLERARDVRPSFRLTAANASDVAAICYHLDGLPLAIELAAAWIKILDPPTLLARLERRLSLLMGGMRDAPARQRTLRAAIAWSYDLLDPNAQTLLRCLAVFSGGWTLEAAEALGSASGVPNVLESLTVLSRQSLVSRDEHESTPRYRLLETIREFANEQLRAAGEEECVHRAHFHYLQAFVQEHDLQRLDATVETRLYRVMAEEANLRAAIDWAIVHDSESALRLLAGMGDFWLMADRLVAGRELLEQALQAEGSPSSRERARVLQLAAHLAHFVGDFARGVPFAEQAHALAEQFDDARTLAWLRLCEGSALMSRGDRLQARRVLETAVARFETLQDSWGLYYGLTDLGIAEVDAGAVAAAAASFERVGAIAVELRLPDSYRAHYLINIAEVYRHLGQLEAGVAACVEALALTHDHFRRNTNAGAQMTLGRLLLERGEPEEAAPLVAASLGFFWEISDKWNLAPTLEAAAATMFAVHRAEPAARLLGAANALREAMPWPIGILDRPWHASQMAAISSDIGEPAFTQAWMAGQANSLEKSVSEARALLTAWNT